MKETKKFKTESKRLLDLMINSIYTNQEIFLRELISNASDAMDKRHYLSLTTEEIKDAANPEIRLVLDNKNRTITIIDDGIGMTHDELIDNLGTIAKSGSREFMQKMEEAAQKKQEIDIIGQFGVGFYSAFMVAKKVVVETKSVKEDKAYRFTSTGEESYSIEEIDKDKEGTKIILFLRDETEDAHYDEYLANWKIESLVKKYSDYIRYPIRMEVEEQIPEKDAEGNIIEDKYQKQIVDKTLNSMIPIWKKNKKDVTDEEKNEFYKNKFNDYDDPLISMFFHVEGLLSYDSLLYIPSHSPFDLYSEKYEKGLQLYTKGVFIMEKAKDLIPDYLKFVKGLVDSSDLSLNISREMLQKSADLHRIAQNLEKKIINELAKLKDDDFDKYLKFFNIYGTHLKYGIYESYGQKKDLLKDLLIYETLNNEKMLSLKEYIEQKPEEQKDIYYVIGSSKDQVKLLPQMDAVMKKGYDVLILKDDVDEFALMMMHDYDGVEFKNVSEANLDIISEEEKDEINKLAETKKDFLESLKEALKDKVSDVRFSTRLIDSPVCLVSQEGGLSLGMEKVLKQMPNGQDASATKILEINPHHELVSALESLSDSPDDLKEYAAVLYDQALLIEGLPLQDPTTFSKTIAKLMIKATKK